MKGRSRGGLGFAGYAAVFDRPDLGGDVIKRGAFREGLGGRVPLLWEHGRAVGRIERVEEDAKGLRVIGRIGEARAGEAVARGDVRGLSVGYLNPA
ncbi:MAG: HK97 family phage prohead protease, partial [Sphingomonadaceae bacterium]|nr:HK97 family phage prohead protease [Sphingomonadaceae bacterium]